MAEERPDVLLLQETRGPGRAAGLGFLDGYDRRYDAADRPGYSGTAVFSRLPIRTSREGLGRSLRDPEGRTLTVDLTASPSSAPTAPTRAVT